jgi:plasmid stability protein
MARLTLNIDDDLLRRARVRALGEGTSVNAAVRDFLARFADDERSARGLESFLEVARRSTAFSGESGRRWTRDSLYDRWNLRRHQRVGPRRRRCRSGETGDFAGSRGSDAGLIAG